MKIPQMHIPDVLGKNILELVRLPKQMRKQKQFLYVKEVRETSYADVHKFQQRYGFVFHPLDVSNLSFFKKRK